QAADRHPGFQGADGGRAYEARPAGRRGRGDQGRVAGLVRASVALVWHDGSWKRPMVRGMPAGRQARRSPGTAIVGRYGPPGRERSRPATENEVEMIGIIGKKLGMTQIFNDNGQQVPCTVIEAPPNAVLQVQGGEGSGFTAVQLGYGAQR